KARLEFPIGKVLYETFSDVSGPRIAPKGDRIAFIESNAGKRAVAVADLAGKVTTLSGGWERGGGPTPVSPRGEGWVSAPGTGLGYAIYAPKGSRPPPAPPPFRVGRPVPPRGLSPG